jgi:hypothetical protein
MIDIPRHLQDEKFRFVLIKPREKTPFEPEWTIKNNYRYNDFKLAFHLSKDGNYGILCGDGLVIVDADTVELNDAMKKLPATFTVKTGNLDLNRHHYYFICPD